MEQRLWRIIERLRGGIDVRDYKHVILPLVFLRSADMYFSERVAEIEKMKHYKDEVLPIFFNVNGEIYLPEDARWGYLVECAKKEVSNLPARIDRAFRVIMEENPDLDGFFKEDFYAKVGVDVENLSKIILEIDKGIEKVVLSAGEEKVSEIDLTRDTLGLTYMGLLQRFSAKETRGKNRGEFYTPVESIQSIVELPDNFSGKIYDPCVGMGGMFMPLLERKKIIGKLGKVEIFGQEINPDTLKFAKLYAMMRGYKTDFQVGDTLLDDKFKNLKADFVFCNPPFNQRTGKNKNANFEWVKVCLSKLKKNGTAVVLLPGTALSDTRFVEERRKLVSEMKVAAIINLKNTFPGTETFVSAWVLKDSAGAYITFADERKVSSGVKPASVLWQDVLSREDVSLAPSDYMNFNEGLRPEKLDFSDEISRRISEKEMEIRKLRGMLDFSIDWSKLAGVLLSEIIEEVSRVDSEILPGEFGVSLLHVGRDLKLPVVLNSSEDAMRVPKNYFRFKIREEWATKMPAEYLLLLLSRPEVAERLAFTADKSARGEVGKEEFLRLELVV